LTGKPTVNGSGNGARSGAQTLVLLSTPLNSLVLRALGDGPKQQAELRREAGFPAQTTLRAQLKRLKESGVIEKRRRNRFPGVLEYELNATGRELLFVADTTERWLELAPTGPMALGGSPAKAAIKALAEGWSRTILRALAAGPLSLTELDRIISAVSYPSLERRLAAMRLAGLVKARKSDGRGTPYAVTEWARRGIAPLAAAARWERRHKRHGAQPIGRVDVEAALLLSVPLLALPSDISGSCRLAVELKADRGEHRLAGVVIRVERGRIASCTSRLDGKSDAWALGSTTAWLEAVIDADVDRIEPGGSSRLAHALLNGLHEVLFAERAAIA
jgi:DNA-binding HxlR family transcriptional regulator